MHMHAGMTPFKLLFGRPSTYNLHAMTERSTGEVSDASVGDEEDATLDLIGQPIEVSYTI